MTQVRQMSEKKKLYGLFVKDLSDEISEEENHLLEQELAKDKNSKQRFWIIKEFWNTYFPKHKAHNIIRRTEKKQTNNIYRPFNNLNQLN